MADNWKQHAPNLAAAIMRANNEARSVHEEDAIFEIMQAAELDIPAVYRSGCAEGGHGKITMDHARDLASTYHGGEGTHPLARHRDSMG